MLGAQQSLQLSGQRLAFWDVGPKDATGTVIGRGHWDTMHFGIRGRDLEDIRLKHIEVG